MSYVVIAHYRARAGAERQVEDALRRMVAPSRAEAGNRRYEVYRAPDDASVFVLCEEYVDEKAFTAHTESEHFARWLRDGTLPFLEERQRFDLVPLEG